MINPFSATPPNELYFVGEHAEDPNQLLLKGSDGNYYAYEPAEGEPHPVEVTDEWRIENSLPDEALLD